MTAYSLKFFEENVARIIKESSENSEAIYITLDNGESVVLLPAQRYESWSETDYLSSNLANRQHILASIDEYRQGLVIRKSLEELEAQDANVL